MFVCCARGRSRERKRKCKYKPPRCLYLHWELERIIMAAKLLAGIYVIHAQHSEQY